MYLFCYKHVRQLAAILKELFYSASTYSHLGICKSSNLHEYFSNLIAFGKNYLFCIFLNSCLNITEEPYIMIIFIIFH